LPRALCCVNLPQQAASKRLRTTTNAPTRCGASSLWLWIVGLAWSFGFLGFWGPSTTLTAEVFPTRIRGAANGVVWAIAYLVGFILFPFVTVALQQATGSFALSFLCIPVLMIAMAIGVIFMVPEHSGKELNEIIT
jgi:MFS family permease